MNPRKKTENVHSTSLAMGGTKMQKMDSMGFSTSIGTVMFHELKISEGVIWEGVSGA